MNLPIELYVCMYLFLIYLFIYLSAYSISLKSLLGTKSRVQSQEY